MAWPLERAGDLLCLAAERGSAAGDQSKFTLGLCGFCRKGRESSIVVHATAAGAAVDAHGGVAAGLLL